MATKIFLGVNALLFIGYGLVCLAAPSVVADSAGLAMLNGDGAAELRAMYGGLQTAVGMLALAALLRSELQPPVLFVLAFLFFGLASARLLGAIVESGVGSYTFGALGFETLFALVSFALFSRSSSGTGLTGDPA